MYSVNKYSARHVRSEIMFSRNPDCIFQDGIITIQNFGNWHGLTAASSRRHVPSQDTQTGPRQAFLVVLLLRGGSSQNEVFLVVQR